MGTKTWVLASLGSKKRPAVTVTSCGNSWSSWKNRRFEPP